MGKPKRTLNLKNYNKLREMDSLRITEEIHENGHHRVQVVGRKTGKPVTMTVVYPKPEVIQDAESRTEPSSEEAA